jgi:hypothetical protein
MAARSSNADNRSGRPLAAGDALKEVRAKVPTMADQIHGARFPARFMNVRRQRKLTAVGCNRGVS